MRQNPNWTRAFAFRAYGLLMVHPRFVFELILPTCPALDPDNSNPLNSSSILVDEMGDELFALLWLQSFFHDVLQRDLIKTEICHQPLELVVFIFKLAQSASFRYAEPDVFFLPSIKSSL
jgi:hypothetical protein